MPVKGHTQSSLQSTRRQYLTLMGFGSAVPATI